MQAFAKFTGWANSHFDSRLFRNSLEPTFQQGARVPRIDIDIYIYIYNIHIYIYIYILEARRSRAWGKGTERVSEGGMIRLETLIELKCINPSFSSLDIRQIRQLDKPLIRQIRQSL